MPHTGPLVPRHIIAAVESDLLHAEAAPGQRIVRGTFVVHYVRQLLEAVKTKT